MFSAGRLTAWLRIQRTENSLMEKWFEPDSLFRDKVAADFLFRIIQPLEVCPFTLSPNFEFRVPKAPTATTTISTSTTTSTPTTPSSSPPLSRASQHATPGTPTRSSGGTPEVININTKVTLTPVSGNNGTTTPSRRSTNEESKNKTQTPAGTPLPFWEMEPLISASELLVASDEEDAYPPLLDPWNPDGSQSKKNPGLANKGKALIKKVKDKIKDKDDDEDVKGSNNKKGREQRAKEKGKEKEKEKEDDNFDDVEVVPWRGSGSTSGGKPNAVWG